MPTFEDKIGDYYTSLTTDKRFLLVDGLWDLRSRHTSDKVLSSVEDDEEEKQLEENETKEIEEIIDSSEINPVQTENKEEE